jgi:predicted dehydrogenase
MTNQLRIAVIGTGLQAERRLSSMVGRKDVRVVCIAGRREEPTKALAELFGSQPVLGWEKVIKRDDVDAIVICTPPHTHLEIAATAMEAGKHVLCEKPLAITLKDAEMMVSVAKKESVVLKCGFNHRYHPGITLLKRWVEEGTLGKIYYIRSRYGHCGRPGYENDWRSDPKLVAGGQLMEHGIHVLDLFRMLLGDFHTVVGFVSTSFWPIAPLEDNAMAIFRNKINQAAFIHSSLTQWRNLFSFEVCGENGIGSVEGLGGSYGVERAIFNPREFEKPFREEVTEFRGEDKSWALELEDFILAIKTGREPSGNGRDGVEALRMVFAVYESAKRLSPVEIRSVGALRS